MFKFQTCLIRVEDWLRCVFLLHEHLIHERPFPPLRGRVTATYARNFELDGVNGKGHPRRGHETHRASRSARWRRVVNAMPRPVCPENDPVGHRVGLDGCGKSRPFTGIRSPDHAARRETY